MPASAKRGSTFVLALNLISLLALVFILADVFLF
jgi:hypothetical protein